MLLAHERGSEDFDGMCYMNLSDYSPSIDASIKGLQDNVAKLKIVDGATGLTIFLEAGGSVDGSKN